MGSVLLLFCRSGSAGVYATCCVEHTLGCSTASTAPGVRPDGRFTCFTCIQPRPAAYVQKAAPRSTGPLSVPVATAPARRGAHLTRPRHTGPLTVLAVSFSSVAASEPVAPRQTAIRAGNTTQNTQAAAASEPVDPPLGIWHASCLPSSPMSSLRHLMSSLRHLTRPRPEPSPGLVVTHCRRRPRPPAMSECRQLVTPSWFGQWLLTPGAASSRCFPRPADLARRMQRSGCRLRWPARPGGPRAETIDEGE